jgi:tetratricopeptide (TPR) repeat protein
VDDFTRLIEAAPKDPMCYARRARAYDRAWNPQAAEADWTRAIELDPHQPRWLFERGVTRAYRMAAHPRWRPDEARRLWDSGTTDLLAVIDRVALEWDDYLVLSDVVWRVVKDTGAGADRFHSAVRLAEAARAGWIGSAELTTLGLARYRVGRYREAAEALAASDVLRPGHPVNLAVLAMAQHRLGNGAEAARSLGEARRAAGRPEHAGDAEAAGFLQEAEQATAGGREVAPPPRPVGG